MKRGLEKMMIGSKVKSERRKENARGGEREERLEYCDFLFLMLDEDVMKLLLCS